MEPYDVALGPIQQTFDDLFKRIGDYFNSAPVVPVGTVIETNLSIYTQEPLHKTLNNLLKYYGFTDLPLAMRIIAEESTQISGLHRSDEITVYDEKLTDGSHRTYNFYGKNGPANIKVSYYWLDMKKGGEQTQGILTDNDRWYLRITTTHDSVYYQRIEKAEY
jgi:hypothetical protein